MLTIFAQQDSQSGRPESDLKTLSGGERSFVTVCYLLALCKKLQGCFHALDEFDVFMDNVNRGVRAGRTESFPCRSQSASAVLRPLLAVLYLFQKTVDSRDSVRALHNMCMLLSAANLFRNGQIFTRQLCRSETRRSHTA